MKENTILFDSFNKELTQYGKFSGSFIIKLNNLKPMLIFSDKILIDRIEENEIHKIVTHGLNLGVKHNGPYSKESDNEFINISPIDYILRIPQNIVREFDNARFSGVYPNIIRFLHTALLYSNGKSNIIETNHLSLVQGEILNRPVAISENMVIISDRMVIEENNNPIFYDSIIIKREQYEFTNSYFIDISYEPFGNVELDHIDLIFLLGSENF